MDRALLSPSFLSTSVLEMMGLNLLGEGEREFFVCVAYLKKEERERDLPFLFSFFFVIHSTNWLKLASEGSACLQNVVSHLRARLVMI